MPKPTHVVVAIDEGNSRLTQSAMLGELRPAMQIIAWCQNSADADIVCRALQAMNSEQKYYVLEIKKRSGI